MAPMLRPTRLSYLFHVGLVRGRRRFSGPVLGWHSLPTIESTFNSVGCRTHLAYPWGPVGGALSHPYLRRTGLAFSYDQSG